MPRSVLARALALFALPSLLAGACGGGDDEGPPLPACVAGTMKLEGTVAGLTLVLEDSVHGGYSQDDDGGDFMTQQGTRGGLAHDPAVIDVRLKWTGGALESASSRPATGDTVLPTKLAAMGGARFCAGAGSTIAQASPDELRYRLRNLKGGTDCTQPVAGELRGCWHFRNTLRP